MHTREGAFEVEWIVSMERASIIRRLHHVRASKEICYRLYKL
jgi:hypothetical protein